MTETVSNKERHNKAAVYCEEWGTEQQPLTWVVVTIEYYITVQ